MVKNGVRRGTEWSFVLAGCQYRNELVESRVKALMSTLSQIILSTIISSKQTLLYAELCVLLSRAASDHPIGVRGFRENNFQQIKGFINTIFLKVLPEFCINAFVYFKVYLLNILKLSIISLAKSINITN